MRVQTTCSKFCADSIFNKYTGFVQRAKTNMFTKSKFATSSPNDKSTYFPDEQMRRGAVVNQELRQSACGWATHRPVAGPEDHTAPRGQTDHHGQCHQAACSVNQSVPCHGLWRACHLPFLEETFWGDCNPIDYYTAPSSGLFLHRPCSGSIIAGHRSKSASYLDWDPSRKALHPRTHHLQNVWYPGQRWSNPLVSTTDGKLCQWRQADHGIVCERLQQRRVDVMPDSDNGLPDHHYALVSDADWQARRTRWGSPGHSQAREQPGTWHDALRDTGVDRYQTTCHLDEDRRISHERNTSGGVRHQWKTEEDGVQKSTSDTNARKLYRLPNGHVIDGAEEEHIWALVGMLKSCTGSNNGLEAIEICVTASGLPLKTYYIVNKASHGEPQRSRPRYIGSLYLNQVLLARSSHRRKRQLKQRIYRWAFERLRTRSLEDILSEKDASLNIEPAINPDVQPEKTEQISESLKFERKLQLLKDAVMQLNPTAEFDHSTLDQIIASSGCGLKHSYQLEPVYTGGGIYIYTAAKFFLDGRMLTSADAVGKRGAKLKVISNTLDILRNTSVDAIITTHLDKHTSDTHQSLWAQSDGNVRHSDTASTEDVLDALIERVKALADDVNVVMTLDKICLQLGLTLAVVYRKGPTTGLACEIYLADRLCARTSGDSRKEAQVEAYKQTVWLLKVSSGQSILSECLLVHAEQLKASDIIDIVYKGFHRLYESNLCRMNRVKRPPVGEMCLSQLVILEHEDWAVNRLKHAHCILLHSATRCGGLLEWTTHTDRGLVCCVVKLQGVEMACGRGRSRRVALQMACAKALFRFYETQPVIRGCYPNYPDKWTTRDQLMRLASDLHQERMFPHTTELTEPLIEAGTDAQVDRNLAAAIEFKLDRIFQQPTLEEFICGPDWKQEEKKYAGHVAKIRGLRVKVDRYCEEKIVIVSWKMDLLEMAKILESSPIKCEGRYRLLSDAEKPTYDDIAGEIGLHESQMDIITKPTLTGLRAGGPWTSEKVQKEEQEEEGKANTEGKEKEKKERKEKEVNECGAAKLDASPHTKVDEMATTSAENNVTSRGHGHTIILDFDDDNMATQGLGDQMMTSYLEIKPSTSCDESESDNSAYVTACELLDIDQGDLIEGRPGELRQPLPQEFSTLYRRGYFHSTDLQQWSPPPLPPRRVVSDHSSTSPSMPSSSPSLQCPRRKRKASISSPATLSDNLWCQETNLAHEPDTLSKRRAVFTFYNV